MAMPTTSTSYGHHDHYEGQGLETPVCFFYIYSNMVLTIYWRLVWLPPPPPIQPPNPPTTTSPRPSPPRPPRSPIPPMYSYHHRTQRWRGRGLGIFFYFIVFFTNKFIPWTRFWSVHHYMAPNDEARDVVSWAQGLFSFCFIYVTILMIIYSMDHNDASNDDDHYHYHINASKRVVPHHHHIHHHIDASKHFYHQLRCVPPPPRRRWQ